MLSQTLISALAVLAVSNGCMAKPILWRPALSKRTDSSNGQSKDQSNGQSKDQSNGQVSFNNYQGISTMSNFDNFNGASNFDGTANKIIIEQDTVRVCHSIQVEVIQQQLTVIREYVKKLVTEQICETEVQTVVLEQFNSGMSGFSKDVRRQSGKPPAYDKNVAAMISKMTPNENGDVNATDLGFNGSSVGNNAVQVQGSNWNDATSPNTTAMAYQMAQKAAASVDNSTSSANSSSSSAAESSTSSSASASASANATGM